MKTLIYFALFSMLFFSVTFTSCDKEPYTEETKILALEYQDPFFNIDTCIVGRAGGDTVLFLPTYSESNLLAGDTIVTHRIFNQARIQYTKFIEDLSKPNFGIGGGVMAKNYLATELFDNDSTSIRQIHVAGATAKEFTHYPSLNNNLLSNSHPAIVVSLSLFRGKKTTNFYRDNPINISTLKVYYNGVYKFEEIFMPWSKAANNFNPGHRVI